MMKPTRKSLYLSGLLFVLVAIFAISCSKDLFDFSTLESDRAVAIPLIETEMDIYDLLDSDTTDLVATDPITGQLVVTYASDLVTFGASDVVTLPDQPAVTESFQPAAALPDGLPFSTTVTVSETPPPYIFTTTGGIEIDSINLTAGSLEFSINNQLAHRLVLDISIPSLISSSGAGFTGSVTALANAVGTSTFDLTSYTFDLTQGGTTTNTLDMAFDITVNGSGAIVNQTDNIDVTYSMTGLQFSAVFGDFKNQQMAAPADSIFISLFKTTQNVGFFGLTDPKVKLIVDNSFGFNSELSFIDFFSMTETGTKIADITYDPGTGQQPAPYAFPTITQPVIYGSTEQTIITMNSTNSNISVLFESTPKYLKYEASAETNPGSPTGNNNYVLSTSELKVSTEVELPLEGYAGNWDMSDTIAFSLKVDELFSSKTRPENVILSIQSTNGFPFDVTLGLKLMDANYNIIHTLTGSSDAIESGTLDGNGKIIASITTVTEITCDRTCIEQMNNTSFLLISAIANTKGASTQQVIKIYDDYKFGLKIGLHLSGLIP